MTARFRESRSRSEAAVEARSFLPALELTVKDLTQRKGREKSEQALPGQRRFGDFSVYFLILFAASAFRFGFSLRAAKDQCEADGSGCW
jgi:hypothetical protein